MDGDVLTSSWCSCYGYIIRYATGPFIQNRPDLDSVNGQMQGMWLLVLTSDLQRLSLDIHYVCYMDVSPHGIYLEFNIMLEMYEGVC